MELFYSLKKGKSSVIPFIEGSGYFMLIGGYKQSEGAIFRLEYNYPMKIEGPNIHFDKFATEDLWALSSLRALLFDEYRITQDINKR